MELASKMLLFVPGILQRTSLIRKFSHVAVLINMNLIASGISSGAKRGFILLIWPI